MGGRDEGKDKKTLKGFSLWRLLWVWTVIVFVTLALSILSFLSLPFRKKGDLIHLYARLWAKAILWASRVKVEVRGVENLPSGPVIFMSNHQSAYDIFVLLAYLPVQFRWFAKKSLFQIPFMGWAMSLAGYIPVEREQPGGNLRSFKEALKRLQEGKALLVFPEGTRSQDGTLKPFKKGGFLLALKASSPVVPISIKGTYEIMPGRSLIPRRSSRVKLIIKPPLYPEDSDLEEFLLRVRQKIIEGLEEARF
jgi:1-acyl-sn-glycerol-3-phosphate acyltransferase